MKVLITGTHFTPAQALIEVLKEKRFVLVYIGRKNTMEGDWVSSIESKILPKYGVKFLPLFAGRLQMVFNIYSVVSLLKFPVGFVQSFIYVLREKPDVTVSFGGYVGFPVVFSSWLLSVPVLVHEQTLVSGLSNKLSSFFADKIAVSFKNHDFLKNPKAFFSGNPVRKEVLQNSKPTKEFKDFLENAKKHKRLVVLVTGGNQGSHLINETVFELLPSLIKKYSIIHQTGDSKFKDFEKLKVAMEGLEEREFYLPKKWIDAPEWSYSLRNVDLIISRAGINTLFEIAYLKKPAIVIPHPFVFQDEQTKNAQYFSKYGFIEILYQKELTPKKLMESIDKKLKKAPVKIPNLDLGVFNAAKTLALALMLLSKENEI